MSDCSVCGSVMTVSEYDAKQLEGSEGDCVRLPCHHAFHAYCIVECLRQSGSGCPICRDGASEPSGLQVLIHALGVDEDDAEEYETIVSLDDDLMQDIRSRHEGVKRKRSEFHKLVKQYNIHKDALRHRRKEHLSKAMATFRRAELPRVKTFQRDIHASMQSIMSAETNEYIRRSSKEALEATTWFESYSKSSSIEYLMEPNSERRQDPMNPKFWKP